MAGKIKTDWEAVEPEYRAGVKSLRQIAQEFGCTSGRVAQVAKERGWTRNLSAKIKALADAKLSKSILSKELNTQKKAAEKEVVEANAEMQTQIILGQRGNIVRYRTLAIQMLRELEASTEFPEEFEKLAEMMAAPDEKGVDRLNEIYRKVISLPQRVDSLKKLAEVLKILIGLERQAFGIADGEGTDKGMDTWEEHLRKQAEWSAGNGR